MFNDAVGAQIAWLLPAGRAWGARSRCGPGAVTEAPLASVLLWSGWFALYVVVFSLAKGTFHSYYTSVMAPAIGAMIGIGSVGAHRLGPPLGGVARGSRGGCRRHRRVAGLAHRPHTELPGLDPTPPRRPGRWPRWWAW